MELIEMINKVVLPILGIFFVLLLIFMQREPK